MKHTFKIQHLYLYIPDFDQSNIQCEQQFLIKISQELNYINKQHGYLLKTIYLVNGAKAITFLFLQKILMLLANISKNIIEYSFETSVNAINNDILKLLQIFSINRLVWKVKTFQQELTNDLPITIISNSIKMGFINFSLDLNYNIVNQTQEQLLCDLQQCVFLQVPHISFDNSDDYVNRQFKTIINDFLKFHNYHNYEYYSYAKNRNNYSQYTVGYCLLENYYGLGPNAVSYVTINNGAQLFTNSDDILYQKTITYLDSNQCFVNKLLQGLLLRSGITLTKRFKKDMSNNRQLMTKLLDNGQIMINNHQLFCTNIGWTLLNDIIIDIITNTTM